MPHDLAALKKLQSRVRHDMLNALNPIVNYCEMWLEDGGSEVPAPCRDALLEIHSRGKECQGLLNRIAAAATPPAAPIVEAPCGDTDGTAVESGLFLVVDDNADNREILCRMLKRQGHTGIEACNGREALRILQEQPVDVVLLDVMMPEMDGHATLQALKADPNLRGLPVIMISAMSEEESCIRCIALGAEDYLPKPFNALLLQARINACLEKKRFHDRERNYLRQIERERQRADELLHVILPHEVVRELKATNAVQPRRHDNVAVLFADITSFTPYCDGHDPVEVVRYLQGLVEAWEESAVRHDVEKIKTIGDAFMAASGLLKPQPSPVMNCVRCGLELIAAAQALATGWNLRVGIHVGPVVAGVIGRRQYLFDLWGDTVNTAARMESHGIPGAITLSRDAWQQIAGQCSGEALVVPVKGKGSLEMVRFRAFLPKGPHP